MTHIRGSVVHCGRFGCIVRLADGRLAIFPSGELGIDTVKRALGAGRRPTFPFIIVEERGRRARVKLDRVESESVEAPEDEPVERFSSSLEQKIIDFWRQASEWDRNAGRVEEDETHRKRQERLLPFEERAPRQYRDHPKRPRKGLKSTRPNR